MEEPLVPLTLEGVPLQEPQIRRRCRTALELAVERLSADWTKLWACANRLVSVLGLVMLTALGGQIKSYVISLIDYTAVALKKHAPALGSG